MRYSYKKCLYFVSQKVTTQYWFQYKSEMVHIQDAAEKKKTIEGLNS